MNLDDPQTTAARRAVLRRKHFLRRIYTEWYVGLAQELPPEAGPVLELGSGAGFLVELIPGLIASDLMPVPDIHAVLDGHDLPFASGSLRAILLVNVLHHMQRPQRFLAESARCLRAGGRLAMLEPWVTVWSRFVYRRLHHEPFHPESPSWEFDSSGPLSGANSALPWMIFERDRTVFEREHPLLEILSVRPTMPVRYLLSGGFTAPGLMPGWTFPAWAWVERPLAGRLAMFAQITLAKRGLGEA
jgi:SAM-dependent methyltransferase